MASAFRVRFAEPRKVADPATFIDAASESVTNDTQRRNKPSRRGCRECKIRRVKCDETFPVCKRCRRHNRTCSSNPPSDGWLREQPGPSVLLASQPFKNLDHTSKELLQWWFEKVCHVLLIDPNVNLLSLPILQHLESSPALAYALQSLSAAHKGFFDHQSQALCLEKRHMALRLLREELAEGQVPLSTLFLAVFILGVSTSWVHGSLRDWGKDHFFGARAIVNQLLADQTSRSDSVTQVVLAYYLYWDMASVFLVSPDQIPALSNHPKMAKTVAKMRSSGQSFSGSLVHMFYLLGWLLRYCRRLLHTDQKNPAMELMLECYLLAFEPDEPHEETALLARMYRLHGLILFYRICRLRLPSSTEIEPDQGKADRIRDENHQYALDLLKMTLTDFETKPYSSVTVIPLLTAGAELNAADADARSKVIATYTERYACTRIRTCLWAATLLQELWLLRDAGCDVSYLEFMLQKGWRLTLV